MEKETKIRERGDRSAAKLEEVGNTLMLVGITCLFLWLTIVVGYSVPVFTIILGAGAVFAGKIIRDLTR